MDRVSLQYLKDLTDICQVDEVQAELNAWREWEEAAWIEYRRAADMTVALSVLLDAKTEREDEEHVGV
jgi:hypothetical protein